MTDPEIVMRRWIRAAAVLGLAAYVVLFAVGGAWPVVAIGGAGLLTLAGVWRALRQWPVDGGGE